MREIGIGHLQSVVQSPQSCTKAIAYPRKATTRSCIRFKHDERFACRLCYLGRVDVWPNNVFTRVMIEVLWKLCLRILWLAETLVDSGTVIIGIAGAEKLELKTQCWRRHNKDGLLFDRQSHKTIRIRWDKPCIPDIFVAISHISTWRDENITNNYLLVSNHQLPN